LRWDRAIQLIEVGPRWGWGPTDPHDRGPTDPHDCRPTDPHDCRPTDPHDRGPTDPHDYVSGRCLTALGAPH
jgi:hypothetical protein